MTRRRVADAVRTARAGWQVRGGHACGAVRTGARPSLAALAIVAATSVTLAALACPRPAAAVPKDAPSICDAEALFDSSTLSAIGSGSLSVRFRHDCSARDVRIVYVVNTTSIVTGARKAFLLGEARRATLALNLGGESARKHVRVAIVEVTGSGARVARPFTNDITEIIGYDGRGGDASEGCLACGLRLARDVVVVERALAGMRPAEFVALFGEQGEDHEDDAEGRALEAAAGALHGAGISVISANRRLVDSDAYWMAGSQSPTIAFRNIVAYYRNTDVAFLGLELDAGALQPAVGSDVPPARHDGTRLRWDFEWPPVDGLTVAVGAALPLSEPVTVSLRATMIDARRHERQRTFTHVVRPPVATPTPERPGDPSPTVAPTRPTRTPGPTPTLPGSHRPIVLHLPYVVRDPCGVSHRAFDVLVVLDVTPSVRAPGQDFVAAAADAAGAWVAALAPDSDRAASSDRRLGLLTLGAEVRLDLPLTYDLSQLARTLSAVAGGPTECCTRLDVALRAAREYLVAEREGARPAAIVLITDGAVNPHYFDAALEESAAMQGASITLYTIGVGPFHEARLLEGLAGSADRFTAVEEPTLLAVALQRVANALRCTQPD